MLIPIIINGHGGMKEGKYQTSPKLGKKFTFKDGTTIYEGEFNRAIKSRVIERLQFKGLPYIDLVPEQKDISLDERIKRANEAYLSNNRKAFIVEIHSDAGGGSGSGAFVALKASDKSIALANWAKMLFKKHFPESKHRGVKRRNFKVIRYTLAPAVLLENFFMDNELECKKYLLTKEGRDRIADYIIDVIETFIKYHA